MVSTVNTSAGWNYKNVQQQTARSPLFASTSQTEKYTAFTNNASVNTASYATQPGNLGSEAFAAIADNAQGPTQSDTSQKATVTLSTTKGPADINLDEYFSGNPGPGYVNLEDVPLLLPSADNILALAEHASARFQAMLKEHGIPETPAQITFDYQGKMQFPADYAYADELTEAFDETPGLERELSTVNALTSHYVEIQKSAPFREEYSKATTQAAANAILNKYAYLFQDNGNYSHIALTFSDDGDLSVTANGKPVNFV